MTNLAEELGHLKTHVKYPANKAQIVAACKGMHEGRHEDEAWVAKVLPEGTYKNPTEILAALLQKA
jgi:hypothetical protein